MDEKIKTKIYTEYLTEQGYRPEIDSDGDIVFRKEGRVYIIFAEEEDANYFRLAYPNFWPLENDEERGRAFEACNYANATSKVAKVYAVKQDVWASIELYFSKAEDFKPVFERLFLSLANAAGKFAQKMREKSPPSSHEAAAKPE